MNLRDQLKEILPDILPRNPAQSIKGTELIELVKHKLKQDYSDATLRYHFSIMSCDPSSPIAKVEQGQGYYLRTSTMHSVNSARNLFHGGGESGSGSLASSSDMDLTLARAGKFRAVVRRYLESVRQFPFSFEQSFSVDADTNRWRVPDLAVVDWLAGEATDDDVVVLDKRKLEVRRRLGQSPLRISSAKLRLELNSSSLPEDLYQCLATSEWANAGELLVAAPIDDPGVIEEVRRFAARYGVGVISFGLEADVLDDMPEPAAIENLSTADFDAIRSLLKIRRFAAPDLGRDYDWQHVTEAATENPDFARFEDWISRCLLEERVVTAGQYDDLARSADSTVAREYVA